MSKKATKRSHEQDLNSSKKIKLTQKKQESNVNFDEINELILKTHPNLDTNNLELIKFLTIFDILHSQMHKINQNKTTEAEEQEKLDSVDGVPEIIKIICKTLLQLLTESLEELKLPINIKKILINLKKTLKLKKNGENKNNSKEGEFKTSEVQTTETTATTEE